MLGSAAIEKLWFDDNIFQFFSFFMAKNLTLRSFHDFMTKSQQEVFIKAFWIEKLFLSFPLTLFLTWTQSALFLFNKYFVAMKTEMLSILK